MRARKIMICMVLTALAAASAHAETGASPESNDNKNWLTLDQFLQQAPAQSDAAAPQPQMVLLPSLSPHAVTLQNTVAPIAIKPVELAALPPLFERPKPQAKPEGKKAAAKQQVLPKLVAEVETPKPAVTEACVKPTPELTQKAKNYASDSATLAALQRAVQDLKLNDKMDFLLPAQTRAPVKSEPMATPAVKP